MPSILASRESNLDAAIGNVTSRTEQYAYDALNRLTSVDYGDGQTQSYSFDSMGNRASKTDAGGGMGGSEAYSYNAANMLLGRAGNPYLSDANGNTLSGLISLLVCGSLSPCGPFTPALLCVCNEGAA